MNRAQYYGLLVVAVAISSIPSWFWDTTCTTRHDRIIITLLLLAAGNVSGFALGRYNA